MAPAISTPEVGASSDADTPMLDANTDRSSEAPDGPSAQNAAVRAPTQRDLILTLDNELTVFVCAELSGYTRLHCTFTLPFIPFSPHIHAITDRH